MSKYQRARGVYDRLPHPPEEELWKSSYLWDFILSQAKKYAMRYGFEEVVLPTFENTELFQRSVGDTSDIVTKEMYTFEDKGGRLITLRPECTASMVRSYIENSLFQTNRQKFFYIANCFRHDRMQKGRYREFYQFGLEAFGSKSPLLEVEIIDLLFSLFNRLGLKDLQLVINSIGEKEARERYVLALKEYLEPFKNELSADSQVRFEKNPLRILDSKNEHDQKLLEDAPKLSSFLDEESQADFTTFTEGLQALSIPYVIDEKLVRGLDYYNKTVFEIIPTSKAGVRQNTVAAGGRYDSLVEVLGGPATPAIGVSVGIERLIQTLIDCEVALPRPKTITLLFISLSENCDLPVLRLAHHARNLGIITDVYRKGYNIKKALKYASDIGAHFAAIMGEDELQTKEIVIKNLTERTEVTTSWTHAFDYLQPTPEDIP